LHNEETAMPKASEPIFALIATKDRWYLLTGSSLPSVRRQTHPPSKVVLVNDGHAFSHDQQRTLAEILGTIPVDIFNNRRRSGVAGAWNTGLEHIATLGANGFVAILDDDDEWDSCHLAENETLARSRSAEIVISGLRLVIDGVEHHRDFVQSLADHDFFVGNPGWQGSNTFVRLSLLLQVGGFRDGLQSLNDRDLAIRLLRASRSSSPAFVGKWTSSWHIRTNEYSLSARRSPAKLSGLRWFWRIYGPQMSDVEADAFFDRTANLFDITRVQVTDANADVPPHCLARGDLFGN
jgi:glycosyltransferase involved in cell wall biosynthesis